MGLSEVSAKKHILVSNLHGISAPQIGSFKPL